MKFFHLCIITMLTIALSVANPLNTSALETPNITEIPTHFSIMSETDNKNIVQVFDIKSGKVIKTIPNDDQIQQFANQLISSITGLAPEVSPDSSAQSIIRIPISTPRQIKVGQTNLFINELFLFHYKTKHSLLLVFDENKKPFLLQYTSDSTPLIKYILNSD